jgi:tetratricopeptide (TPR) repeat protein
VFWGKFDNTYIQVRVFLSGGEQGGTEVPGTEQIGLASSDPSGELAFKVQGVITDNLLFLAPFVLGYLQYHSNNYEAGHQAFDVAMDNIPTNVEIENEAIVHFFRARKMARTTLDAQAFEEVVCEYKQAILEDPGFDVAYNNLGLVISRLYGEKPPFRDKPSIDMSPGAVTCLQEIQQQGLIVGDYQDPKTYFQRALAVNGNLTLAKFNLYAFKWMQSPGPEALPGILSEIEKIQQADESIVGTYIILGVAKERGGDAAGAIKMYQLGIKQMENPGRINPADPKLALMRFNLGQLFSQQEDWSAAETEFKQIVDSNPRDYGAIRVLGNLYYRQGKFSEAALHLDAILTTSDSSDPGMPFYKSTAFILRSGGEYKQGGISSAINYLNQAAQTTPRDPYPHFLLGLLYQAQGSNDLAIASFNKSNELDTPPEPAPWSTFKDQCLRDTEVDANSFANWAMDKLPSSPCLGRNLSDPNERIITFYNMLSDLLLQGRELPSFGMTSAQCPYVYTADPVTGNWEFDTTIMYKIVDREAAQMRPLTQFNGRLLIREQEPEISYINRLYVLAKMSDGSYQLLEPDVEDLKHSDDDYIVLHQGDEILVSLDGYPVTGDVSQWWVMAVGYYTPLGK